MSDTSTPAPFDFDAARDAGSSCINAVFLLRVRLGFCSQLHEMVKRHPEKARKSPEEALQTWQGEGAEAFGVVASSYARAFRIATPELRRMVMTASITKGDLPMANGPSATDYRIGTAPCETWLDAVLQMVADILHIPMRVGAEHGISFPDIGPLSDSETGKKLCRVLLDLDHEGLEGYWEHVSQRVADYPTGNEREVFALLSQEIEVAKSVSGCEGQRSAEPSETDDAWSKPRWRDDWADLYGVSPTTFDRRRKAGHSEHIRSRKSGKKIQIHVEDLPNGCDR